MRFLSLLLLPLLPVASIMRGVSWFGCETEYNNFMCVWEHDQKWHLQKIQELGFNTIRVPFSSAYLKTDMKALDEFFKNILDTSLMVVLDYHRIENNFQPPKPYNEYHSVDDFINDWIFILNRYSYNSHLVGIDVWNEWVGPDDEWNDIAKKVISRIEKEFPYRVFYIVGCSNWAGNCKNIDVSSLPFQNRIFYGIHKYTWSDDGDLEQKWDYSFGKFVGDGTKIIVGEFGFKSDLPNQLEWFKAFIQYLKSRNIYHSFFWTWSFNSGDTGGLLQVDCSTIDMLKLGLLQDYWTTQNGYHNKRRHLRTELDVSEAMWFSNATAII